MDHLETIEWMLMRPFWASDEQCRIAGLLGKDMSCELVFGGLHGILRLSETGGGGGW